MNKTIPPLLKEIDGTPKKIFMRGEWPSFEKPWIAVVGTRKATNEGIEIAKKFSISLSRAGAIIVSGLAFGIDAAAHEGALSASGITIAVLGNGVDKIYPAQNEALGKKIIESGGALVSEYPDGSPSLPHQFLERNRIISGLSHAVVIIEAPERSGAISTAGHAATQGREVFVVPGPIYNKNYAGSHRLIRDGARLVTSPEEILEDLGIKSQSASIEDVVPSLKNENQKILVGIISKIGKPATIDEITRLSKLEPQVVNKEITFLLIQGIIKENESGYTI